MIVEDVKEIEVLDASRTAEIMVEIDEDRREKDKYEIKIAYTWGEEGYEGGEYCAPEDVPAWNHAP